MFSKSVVKYIQSLQQKKFRESHSAFVAEGPKVVEELLNEGIFKCRNIYATDDWNYRGGESVLPIIRVKDHELEKLAAYSTPNLVVAEFETIRFPLPDDFNGLNIILDDIRDPGNLGTIIRTADWFGINYILCSEESVDVYNPKVVQSTMASLGRVKVVYTDIESFINARTGSCLAATLDGKNLDEADRGFEGFLIIGNESAGIRSSVRDKVKGISIPGFGKAESLNAAIAAGILMYSLRG